MSNLPNNVSRALVDPVYKRPTAADVQAVEARMGVSLCGVFRELFETYRGTFGSEPLGYELLDINAMEPITLTCRKEFGFPDRFLVMTQPIANAVLVYDTKSDAVYDVDFEGSDEELVRGELEPRWPSFSEFLTEYFSVSD